MTRCYQRANARHIGSRLERMLQLGYKWMFTMSGCNNYNGNKDVDWLHVVSDPICDYNHVCLVDPCVKANLDILKATGKEKFKSMPII